MLSGDIILRSLNNCLNWVWMVGSWLVRQISTAHDECLGDEALVVLSS
jgi:hypothetical protein